MNAKASSIRQQETSWAETLPTLLIGRIVEIDNLGQAWVDYPGNPVGAVPAESVMQVESESVTSWIGRRVLLGFDNDLTNPPVILGCVHSSFVAPARAALGSAAPATEEASDPRSQLRLTATNQISLECGRSSITMRKDGKIVIKGEQIVSRAVGTNRIKGGSVAIN